MALIRFINETGQEKYGEYVDANQAEILADNPLAGIVRTGEMQTVKRLLAPIVPVTIYGIGLNYKRHAQETGAALPAYPVVFMKPVSALAGPGDEIVLPTCSHGLEVDYECELAVIIGTKAKNVPPEKALEYVLGYTAAIDVSARKWQKHGGGGQWVRGKSFDTFCPLGPRIVTTREIGNPQKLNISTTLNGEIMQSSNTADMIFSVKELVSFLSQDTTLLPGTVILTGTPEGVGFVRKPPVFLKPEDRVVVEIEKIGKLACSVKGAEGFIV